MQLRVLLITCLACSTFGCATDNSQTADSTSSRGPGDYRTGSRLPTYEPASASTAKEVSKDDWIDDRRTGGMQGKWQ